MEGKQDLDLETAVECAYRVPANRGSLWVALWLWPIPAEMALFLTGPRQRAAYSLFFGSSAAGTRPEHTYQENDCN